MGPLLGVPVYTQDFSELVGLRLPVCVSYILIPKLVLAILGLGEFVCAL